MFELDGISTEAKVGKILLFIGLVLKIITVLSMFLFGSLYALWGFHVPQVVMMSAPVIAIVLLVGIAFGFISLRFADEGAMSRASIIALVGSVLPPVDVLYLVAGILFMVSKEAQS